MLLLAIAEPNPILAEIKENIKRFMESLHLGNYAGVA